MKYLIALVLITTGAGCAKEASVKTVRIIDSPRGQYESTSEIYAAGTHRVNVIHELNASEIEDLRSDEKDGIAFIKKYAPETFLADDVPFSLDAAFAAWTKSTDAEKETNERVIRMVGAAFGFYCVEKLGIRWAMIKDDQGVDLALVRTSPEVFSFPFSSIRHRVEDRETDFIYPLYVTLEEIIQKGSLPVSGRSNATPMRRPIRPSAAVTK